MHDRRATETLAGVAVLVLGQGDYGLRVHGEDRADPMMTMPMFPFGGHETWLVEHGIDRDGLGPYLEAHRAELADVLDTVALREGATRSSIADICGHAHDLETTLRNAIAEAVDEHLRQRTEHWNPDALVRDIRDGTVGDVGPRLRSLGGRPASEDDSSQLEHARWAVAAAECGKFMGKPEHLAEYRAIVAAATASSAAQAPELETGPTPPKPELGAPPPGGIDEPTTHSNTETST